jgi:uncharacterized protein (DUF1800 family)
VSSIKHTALHKKARVHLAIALLCSMTCAPDARAISTAINISTRMKVETGDNVLIAGFIINGTGQKKIIVRALGPSLPVAGTLSDPMLELHDGSGKLIGSNDNWRSSQEVALIASGIPPKNDREAALIATLVPGPYTVVVKGVNGATGVGLVEVYDDDSANTASRLINISTRGHILTNDNVMIGGFILRGDLSKRMLVRVVGPTLNLHGQLFAGRLQDPTLELHDGNGVLMMSNNNWRSTQQMEIEASTLAPNDDREPALVATLKPGNYTAIARGANGTTGIALIEMYDLDEPPQADGSTLFIAQLRPQSGTISGGSGTATMRLSADEKSVILSFSYTNLSSPVTGMHIHGPANPGQTAGILFDVDAATPRPDGTYIWVLTPVGGNTVADIVAAIKSGRTYFNIHTTNYPNGEISGFFNLSHGSQVVPTPTPPPPLASGTPSPQDACRFLNQATFGATSPLITQVQQQGFDGFLNQQFAAPASSHLAFVDASGVNPPTMKQEMDAWWTYAVTAPDQLRQRVAFALSELLVVSTNSGGLGNHPDGMAAYEDVLLRDAFVNYRQLLEDITLNPAMGRYLDMLHSDKGNPAKGTMPNENYAREVMQLFSIGLYRLNLDGSLTLSAQGIPLDTYNQDAVIGLAAAFTGWNYGQAGTPVWYGAAQNYRVPMEAVPSHHATQAKQILNGVLLPANQTPQQDLKLALDTIFNHPNVGPFVCRRLIQRLVTSNPSTGYLYRVASVFNNNGHGVRGDMRAVIHAILMDYDARGPAKTAQGAGHEKEPVLRLTNVLRAFKASSPSKKFELGNATSLGETPLHSPTVFNFFEPDFAAAGDIAIAGLTSPEFQITTETTVSTVANYLYAAIYSGLGPASDRVTLDLSLEQTLATNPTQLVDHLNSLLMAGSMSSQMRTRLITAVTNIPANNPTERARTAIYLVVNSPEFVVEN